MLSTALLKDNVTDDQTNVLDAIVKSANPGETVVIPCKIKASLTMQGRIGVNVYAPYGLYCPPLPINQHALGTYGVLRRGCIDCRLDGEFVGLGSGVIADDTNYGCTLGNVRVSCASGSGYSASAMVTDFGSRGPTVFSLRIDGGNAVRGVVHGVRGWWPGNPTPGQKTFDMTAHVVSAGNCPATGIVGSFYSGVLHRAVSEFNEGSGVTITQTSMETSAAILGRRVFGQVEASGNKFHGIQFDVVKVNSGVPYASNVHVGGGICINNSMCGVYLLRAMNCTVSGIYTRGNGVREGNIRTWGVTGVKVLGDVRNVHIDSVTCEDEDGGIGVSCGVGEHTDGVTFSRCYVPNTLRSAAFSLTGDNGGSIKNVFLDNNRFIGKDYGMYVRGSVTDVYQGANYFKGEVAASVTVPK